MSPETINDLRTRAEAATRGLYGYSDALKTLGAVVEDTLLAIAQLNAELNALRSAEAAETPEAKATRQVEMRAGFYRRRRR